MWLCLRMEMQFMHLLSQRYKKILKNHQQSGRHSSSDERLLEIRNSFLSPKGKNMDMGIFYAFLMLEDKDLKFASRSLEFGIRASTGLGTAGVIQRIFKVCVADEQQRRLSRIIHHTTPS